MCPYSIRFHGYLFFSQKNGARRFDGFVLTNKYRQRESEHKNKFILAFQRNEDSALTLSK